MISGKKWNNKTKIENIRIAKEEEMVGEATGILEALKKKAEVKSGLSLDSVRVHYQSSRPKSF